MGRGEQKAPSGLALPTEASESQGPVVETAHPLEDLAWPLASRFLWSCDCKSEIPRPVAAAAHALEAPD